MDKLKNNIDVAMGKLKADLVLKNASIINVFTQSIEIADVAINKDTIIGIGNYEGIDEIDCHGQFVAPGFIDSHVHIESSMVTPEVFSHLVIKKGVTTIIADPHEIANVMGEEGIRLMLNSSEKGAIDAFYMLPTCVPAIDFEDSGAVLNADTLLNFINEEKILGLAEVMDVNAVTSGKPKMLEKINLASENNKFIDGHCPNLEGKELSAYRCAGISTDHESTDPQEALTKIKIGMYVMLREGSAAKDLINLLPAVDDKNYQRFLFCTDDRHIEDLMEIGSIDNCIRLAIKGGLEPLKAYTIATLNAANCYNLKDRGAIAPGLKADLVIFSDLEKLEIKNIIKDGKFYDNNVAPSKIESRKSINLKYVNEDTFQVKFSKEFVNVIRVHPGSLKTTKVKRRVQIKNNIINNVIEKDKTINKIAVIERHKFSGKYFTGFIEGLGLRNAAIAQSIAHDSHNIIVIGDNDLDMMIAVNNLIDKEGGIVIVSNGKLLEAISLPIGGLMTSEEPEVVLKKIKALNQLAREHGINADIDPFVTLSFMALPVIPDLKITARGLFHYSSFKFIDLLA